MQGKSYSLGVLSVLTCIGSVAPSYAFRSGPPAGHNGSTASGGATCMVCHGSAIGGGMVEILGVPAQYEADALYDLTVRISDPAQAGAGFQLSVETAAGSQAGTLIAIDATNTQLNVDPRWINHTQTGVNNAVATWAAMGNAAEYDVRWQAPATDVGPVTFWAAGNAINNDFFNTGDIIYLTNESATFLSIVPAAGAWGLLAMGLVVLIAGTIVVGRSTINVSATV